MREADAYRSLAPFLSSVPLSSSLCALRCGWGWMARRGKEKGAGELPLWSGHGMVTREARHLDPCLCIVPPVFLSASLSVSSHRDRPPSRVTQPRKQTYKNLRVVSRSRAVQASRAVKGEKISHLCRVRSNARAAAHFIGRRINRLLPQFFVYWYMSKNGPDRRATFASCSPRPASISYRPGEVRTS